MLKHTIVCVMLVAATTMGWEALDVVPNTTVVEHGAHLTWGNGLIWAMLPVYAGGGGNQRTDVLTCTAFAGEDSMWDDSTITPMAGVRLLHAGLTFQWKEQPVLWGCGWHEDGGDTWSKLYCYLVDSGDWGQQETITVFDLDYGASIAYYPNGYYHALNYACPGWIYCLPGGSQEFWRFAIPGTFIPDIAEDGFYPGPGAIVADQTPLFKWGSSATPTYRLLVSSQSDFSDTVIDEQCSNPEHEPTSELANGTYYWRTAAWVSSAWSWSDIHTFDLQGGWQSLAEIPETTTSGAIIACDSGSFGSSWSILALPGGAIEDDFYRYIIAQDSWVQLDTTPEYSEDDGTSLTTRTPTQAGSALIMAAFSSEGSGDVPYRYIDGTGWDGWCNESGVPIENSHFPRYIGPYSSMVIGGGDLMYLLTGCDEHGSDDFYWVELPADGGGGGEAGPSQINGVKTHVIARYDGVEVEYQLPVSARVRATLHDAVGRQVGVLDAGEQKPGIHRLSWDRDNEGRRLSAGAYFVLLDMGTEQSRLKAVVR